MENNVLVWLQQWYTSQCDGEWEHDEGIKIYSSDNPGWVVEINVKATDVETLEKSWELHEESEDNWFGYSIQNGIFSSAGDPTKLILLLLIFKGLLKKRRLYLQF
ncbi:immunity 53 family protein [Pontibacter pudoricolor]|uniref:immunity 53 family protein n=1 Tax=Pontibacter pudoricolor TaxID=2694930 RepID=UPI00139100A9|nr:immunity 53 family protein [Pontibacter pudoricolor]